MNFLTQMNGFESNHHMGIIVIEASNRIIDLEEALLPPGLFDLKIKVNLPNFNESKNILKVHAKNKNLSPEINLLDITKQKIWIFWCRIRKYFK